MTYRTTYEIVATRGIHHISTDGIDETYCGRDRRQWKIIERGHIRIDDVRLCKRCREACLR